MPPGNAARGAPLLLAMRTLLAGVALALCATRAHADDEHLVVAEVLGKAGLYGVGYEYTLAPRLSVGAVASFAAVRGQQLWSASPYLHVTVLGTQHRLFGELGAAVVHSRIASPVDDWDGMTGSGVGGVLAAGYERVAERFVLRAYGAVHAGRGGVAPWLGLAIGYRP